MIRWTIALLLAAHGTAQYRATIHPKAEKITSIAEAPDRLLWLAAADGLYRFDGLNFQRVVDYPDRQAAQVAFTADGTLWVRGMQGVWRYRDGFRLAFAGTVDDIASQGDHLWVATVSGLIRLAADGSMTERKLWTRRQFSQGPGGAIWLVCAVGVTRRLCSIRDGNLTMHDQPIPQDTVKAVFDATGTLVLAKSRSQEQTISFWRDGRKIEESTTATTLQRPLVIRDGQIRLYGGGFFDVSGNQVRGMTGIMAAFGDAAGRIWISSPAGLQAYAPDPHWQTWRRGDLDQSPVEMVTRRPGGAIAAATQRNVFELKGGPLLAWKPLPKGGSHEYFGLLPLANGEALATVRDAGVVRLANDGHILESVPDLLRSPSQYREIVSDARSGTWAGGKTALLRLEGIPGSYRLKRERLPGADYSARHTFDNVTDLEFDAAGRLWTAYDRGIAWREHAGEWHRLIATRPISRVRSIALPRSGDVDEIWVAYRPAGAFSRLRKQGQVWTVEDFPASAGYGPPDTHFIKRDSRGWIWRGTPEGVFVSDGKNTGSHDWLHIHKNNGLEGNNVEMYGFFEDTDASVWIAGEGISHFKPDPSWFDVPRNAPPPRVTLTDADGVRTVILGPAPTAFSAAKKLALELGSMHTSPFRQNPFRYRLLPLFDDWRYSRNGRIEFTDLPKGQYTFEAAYAGSGSAAELRYGFRLGEPAQVSAVWPWLLAGATGVGALLWIGRRTSPVERLTYRITKAWFRLRRGFRRSAGAIPVDHAGSILAGRYRIIGAISSGGFSTVYEARDLDSGARIAVKVMHGHDGNQGWARDRFAQEVAALHMIDHPGVVPILDSWVSAAGEPCLAMPFLEGVTLRAELSGGPLDTNRAARIVRELGEALAEVHRRGIVHRDLKPENIVLQSAAGSPVIVDFGTAGLRAGDQALARTTMLSGSFHYMAPERLTGHYSPASDIFSLAVIALEMLTGKRPGDLGPALTDASLVPALEDALAVAPGNRRKAIAQLLAGAYDPDPSRRPADAAAWGRAFGDLAGDSAARSRAAIH